MASSSKGNSLSCSNLLLTPRHLQNQKKPQGARGTANVATSGDNFVQPPGSGVAPILPLAITSAFAIATPTTVTTTCSLVDWINTKKEAVPPLAA
ncbi:hypothetical protein P691DRAFT_769831 [Macrolepiota fuliginosa MF-IS2]|uniref:Uncharacterized protein n=1 Tax=Macrolepiota fuliginosa MF-IS2 TaxID=1400762 RepID=A0A9P5WVU2_9AGAR|nr:hypothetical protein P691DRAFT_769831 [Macrolepiota fuliginosa MF-IS2]